VTEARAALGNGYDLALEVDVCCTDLAVATEDERATLLRRLGELYTVTGISRAEVYGAVFGEIAEGAAAIRVSEFEEDPAGARLAGVWSGERGSLDKLIRDGHVGLIPLAAQISPEAAIVEASIEKFAVIERGNVRILDDVPTGAARLLRELAIGDGDARLWRPKEHLVGAVWGLSHYGPDRHDAVVHTSVSRLRALLGTAGHWIECRDGAYRLAGHVAFRGLVAPASPVPQRASSSSEDETAAQERALLAHLQRSGPSSTAEVASALGVSDMTAFRRMRGLLDRSLVRRTGKGPSTRYTAADSEERRGS
jgi:hypothetical protein